MEQITVVIGDRLGKGQKVAAGAEKAGARAVVVPGVAADMKLGDMMKAENATFGISFCGSISMATKQNMACVPLMRASPRSTKATTYWASALWIKKNWANAWWKPGRRNTAREYERAIHHHGERYRQRREQNACFRRCPEPCPGGGDENVAAHLTAY